MNPGTRIGIEELPDAARIVGQDGAIQEANLAHGLGLGHSLM